MMELELKGCRPEPLMSYLKALGVFRLIAEQKDSGARAMWKNDIFILSSALKDEEIMSFFLNEYRPTPILAPWAGGSGFFEGDNKGAVNTIEQSGQVRLQPYREIIKAVKEILVLAGQSSKPTDDNKEALLRRYRRDLPDNFIAWMDCAMVLQNDRQAFAPVLGTGGNDGRLDFTQNFMQRIVELGLHDKCCKQASRWLENALFDTVVAELSSSAVGQFHPGRAGGPNATQGLEGESLVNPWDFLFMIEGTLILAGSVTKRMGIDQSGKAVFPFTVSASSAGYGSLSASDNDSRNTRGEVWLPLWNRFSSLGELKLVFSEGRAQVGARNTKDGLDFVRAIAGLGVDRGLSSFTRFSLMKRSGKAYLATPLGRFNVHPNQQAEVLREIDPWLIRFRRACSQKNVPSRFDIALRRLEQEIFNFCRYGGTLRFQRILMATGNIERELSRRADKPGIIGDRSLTPIPLVSRQWIDACGDATPELRIARALVSIREKGALGPMRAYLESVQRKGSNYNWVEHSATTVWSSTGLYRNLLAVLIRREMDTRRHGLENIPLDAGYAAPLADIAAFIQGRLNERIIEELLWGIMLVEQPDDWQRMARQPGQTYNVPRAYAVLKLLYLPTRDAVRTADGKAVYPEPEILWRLRAHDLNGACALAAMRLRVSGLVPMPAPASGGSRRPIDFCGEVDSLRLAAALLIPVDNAAALKTLVLRKPNYH